MLLFPKACTLLTALVGLLVFRLLNEEIVEALLARLRLLRGLPSSIKGFLSSFAMNLDSAGPISGK